MLCAAQRNSLCKLAALILGLLSLAHILTASELLGCDESFYRNTPPQRVTDSGLERRCHSLGAGCTFVSLYHPGRQSDVYTALHLGKHNAWGKGTAEELGKSSKAGVHGVESHVHVPALYKGQDVASSHLASPLHKLDTLTAELVESRAIPRCSKTGGDVYVQSGVGGLSETKADVLWSAVCCDVPGGLGSFSMGVVQEGKGELKLMSVKELEELLGTKELFSGGCGQTGSLEEETLEVNEVPDKDRQAAEPDKSSDEDEVSSTMADRTESEPSLEESVNETERSESQKDSLLLRVLSSAISLLCAPLSPVVSTLTNLPSQICYVLQEDAAVLASLPSDSFSLVQNLGSGIVSGVENVGSVAYQVSECGVCSLYTFISTLAVTLVVSCQEGLVGTGTLMGDALGLVTGALGEVWDFGIEIVEYMCQRLGGYVGAVGSEMGVQGWSIGKAIGMLVWRGQKGLWSVISTVAGIIGGVLGNTMENIQEAFSGEQ